MSLLDVNEKYDPICPIYITKVLGFKHLISFKDCIIWQKNIRYNIDARPYFYQIFITKNKNKPIDQQWTVSSSIIYYPDLNKNEVFVNDINELCIAIEAIKNRNRF